jgi:hypothetical protein
VPGGIVSPATEAVAELLRVLVLKREVHQMSASKSRSCRTGGCADARRVRNGLNVGRQCVAVENRPRREVEDDASPGVGRA